MLCPHCGQLMTPLFTSMVCDACDGPTTQLYCFVVRAVAGCLKEAIGFQGKSEAERCLQSHGGAFDTTVLHVQSYRKLEPEDYDDDAGMKVVRLFVVQDRAEAQHLTELEDHPAFEFPGRRKTVLAWPIAP